MKSATIRQRSEVLGTQVITRDTGKRLGVVSQIWVDVDRREVVAIGLRENLLAVAGMPRFMLLKNIRQVGDVILVENETVLEEDVDVEGYSKLTASEVITENGELLGKVRGFKFDVESGKVDSITIDSLGFPQIPDRVVSTYELSMDEIVSSGPDRLIVFEGAEDHLIQLTVGVLERLGIGTPPWEREELNEYYAPQTAKPENQLGSGMPAYQQQPQQETWDADEHWQEREVEPVAQVAEPIYYEEEEEDNWSEASRDTYREEYREVTYTEAEVYDEEYEEDLQRDAWDDEEPTQQRPRINIEKTKVREYEEEPEY